jgi:hypothetical protein
LHDAFPALEARRVLERLEFHHTSKHASWLNMVEIEIGALHSRCLDRCIDDKHRLVADVAAWARQHNATEACINRMFTTEKARQRLARGYPVNES